jgi:multidrug efflux pump subunit AcrA (membrane-fusion protein)
MTQKKLFLAIAVLGVIGFVTWRWMDRPTPDPPPEVTVPVARVQRGDLGDTLNLAGAFKPFQDVDVHAKVAGYVRKIYVDVGDRVKEGQILAVLEVPELAAQLTGAEATVRAAQEQIRRAQGDLQRMQSSHAAVHSAYTRL